ncbi:transmembrane protein, putative [Bodo saltans]|uniref:Transmembrane protein, putative n=1 Tax=Bodo saltans TaxID=75058 RepID=A0A0S4IVH5_BODSA|nr:transmembrane protein, putative [Bodo saltans]|eukprot:CUF11912.1 transmembrane protein, putative [Bodo saltans]
MARASNKMSGGMARYNVIDHGHYLKPVSQNPYIGTVHDGMSTGYGQGFASKAMPFLYRFRHNLLPQGMATGFFSRNPSGKHVHWLEVSTIEKMRVRAVSEDAFPPMFVTMIVIAFTTYHLFRIAAYHPDITMYNLGVFTSKPWIQQMRFTKKHPLDKPVFKFVQRVPSEYFQMEDPITIMYKNQWTANDPWLEFVKSKGLEDQLYVKGFQTKGWGTGGAGNILPRDDVPYDDKMAHHTHYMK